MLEKNFRSHGLVDEGVSLYDRERVEDVEFKSTYKNIVDKALTVYNSNHHPGYVRKFYPTRKSPAQEPPFAFMLPAGEDPHVPVRHLAKACIDVHNGYGFGSVVSVDTVKAARFDRATDIALNRLAHYKKAGMLGVAFMVMRHEDSESPMIASLLEDMTAHGLTDELPEDEAKRRTRINRLSTAIDELAVPHMTLVTMDPYEAPPVFEEPSHPGIDAGTRLY